MLVSTIARIYFSPTGGTKRILDEIGNGLGIRKITDINLTKSAIRDHTHEITEDLILVGVPVYYREIPEVVIPFLKRLDGAGKPTFIVAVYGNVTEGNAINQLGTLLEKQDFYIIGGAIFIAEHSFSSEDFPIAHGRPDHQDLKLAYSAGQQIIKILLGSDEVLDIPKPSFPNKLAVTVTTKLDKLRHLST